MSIDEQRNKRQERRLQTCKHFNGIQHKACRAGIAYDSIPRSPGRSLPCLPGETPCATECAKREFPTPAEVEAREARMMQSLDNTRVAIVAIVEKIGQYKKGKNGGEHGEMPCPVCKTGSLHYSRSSYNGHLHGACTTSTCVRWMQ